MKKRWNLILCFLVFCVLLLSAGENGKDVKKTGKNYPSIGGNGVTFRIFAPEAVLVNIAGQFNGWNEQATPMLKKGDGTWEIVLDLKKGVRHRYKFIIDGMWVFDPDNPDTEPDGFGGSNSIIYVPKGGK